MIPQVVALWSQQGHCVVEAVERQRQRELVLRRLAAPVFYRLRFVTDLVERRYPINDKLFYRGGIGIYLWLSEKRVLYLMR